MLGFVVKMFEKDVSAIHAALWRNNDSVGYTLACGDKDEESGDTASVETDPSQSERLIAYKQIIVKNMRCDAMPIQKSSSVKMFTDGSRRL